MCVCVTWLTVGCLWRVWHVSLWRVALAGPHHGLLHHVDAVALHQLLEQSEELVRLGALERKDSWGNQREGEQKGEQNNLVTEEKHTTGLYKVRSCPRGLELHSLVFSWVVGTTRSLNSDGTKTERQQQHSDTTHNKTSSCRFTTLCIVIGLQV